MLAVTTRTGTIVRQREGNPPHFPGISPRISADTGAKELRPQVDTANQQVAMRASLLLVLVSVIGRSCFPHAFVVDVRQRRDGIMGFRHELLPGTTSRSLASRNSATNNSNSWRRSNSNTNNNNDKRVACATAVAAASSLRGGAVAATTSRSSTANSLKHTSTVLGYFALWYALNVWYNIVNKRVLNALALPVSVAVAQLGIGSIWVGTQWLIGTRTLPGELTAAGAKRLTKVALFHGGGQLATVLSLGAGAVSFTHVVKAMEPFFSALVAAVFFRQVFRWQVYASLLPVVAGVSLACAKEINFSWVSFLAAMASNLLFACRANFSKALMIQPPVRGDATISSANLYGLVTLAAFLVFAPVAVVSGWSKWGPAWQLAMENGHTGRTLALGIFLSGISHYLNNEVMYLALGSVHPTTLAVGNTMKRVFIVVASLVVFKTPISKLGMVGSAIAVGGVLVYSLTKQHYDTLDGKAKAKR